MKIRNPLTVGLALALSLMAAPAMGATGATGHDRIPSAVPSTISPAVNDGQVNGIVQVGATMVIGGTFTNVTPPGGAATARSRVASFDASTGALRSFNPVLNGNVQDVLAGPTADTVYIAGSFTTVDGAAASHLALLNVNTGAPVAGFKAASTNGVVNSITKAGSRLLLGGNFTIAGGAAHGGLASINPTTGVIDAFMGITLTEHHNNTGSGAQGAIGVKDMEATPDGTKMVAVGNFRKANALDRNQAVVIDLSGPSAAVDLTWRTRRYEPLCFNFAFDSYMRGVAVSPDGKYFVIASTGGQNAGSLCDTAARFEFGSTGDDIQPTWIDYAGGDTLWSVEITEQAVYVGGHQRWLNNSEGSDYAGPGAVPRPGLAALDIESGLPLAWNPGRLPRGAAAFSIYASPTGLWVGSDTEYIGNYKYKRPRLAYFPLAGGAQQPSDTGPTLPGNVYLGGRTSPPDTLSTIGFDGNSASGPTDVNNRSMPWDSVRGAFLLGNTLFYGKTDGFMYKRTFTTSTTGTETKIDPYNDPAWADASNGSGGTERGAVPNFYGQISNLTGLFYASDRVYYTLSKDTHLYWRWFNVDSGIVGSQVFTADGGRSWNDTGGLFKSGSTLYIVSKATGALQKIGFTNGAPSGLATVADAGRDWRARAVFIGPGAAAANNPPTASFTTSCSQRTCSVNGSGSNDTDGSVASYAWTYGDGGTDTGVTPPAHTYASNGTYTITLTVTDNQGATASTTRSVDATATPPPASSLSFLDKDQVSVQSAAPQVTVPGNVQVDDQLILVGSYAIAGANPTAPAGWALASSRVATGLESYVWTRRAVAGDAGTAVATTVSASAKSTLTLAAYRGVAVSGGVTAASSTDGATTAHQSPTLAVPAGGWFVELWTDKSGATTTWTPPSGVSVRSASYGTGTGHTSGLLADSGAPVAAGTYGGATASTDAASGRAITWTFALKPA